MTTSEPSQRALEASERQAREWLVRLTSGRATASDAEQFRQWCAQSEQHREAFARAHRQWQQVADAGRTLDAPPLQRTAADRQRLWSRRAFLGAAVAAPAALAVVAAVRPPLDLWPSVQTLAADYHTGTGERLEVSPADNLQVQLDTRTALRRRDDSAARTLLELIQGQAVFNLSTGRPLALFAGIGCIVADAGEARLDVRNLDQQVRVACLHGSVRIEHPQGRLQLQAGQMSSYDERISGVVADAVDVSAWTEGMLVFRNAPLSQVVAEINRYRPGRLLLLNPQLEREPVSGRFRIDDPDAVLTQLQRILPLRLDRYPGQLAVLR